VLTGHGGVEAPGLGRPAGTRDGAARRRQSALAYYHTRTAAKRDPCAIRVLSGGGQRAKAGYQSGILGTNGHAQVGVNSKGAR
jgi:hypothetical protein